MCWMPGRVGRSTWLSPSATLWDVSYRNRSTLRVWAATGVRSVGSRGATGSQNSVGRVRDVLVVCSLRLVYVCEPRCNTEGRFLPYPFIARQDGKLGARRLSVGSLRALLCC